MSRKVNECKPLVWMGVDGDTAGRSKERSKLRKCPPRLRDRDPR